MILRAIALLSGGLDSGLAARLILDQGVEVIGLKFTSPLCRCDQQGRCFAREAADQLGIPLHIVPKGDEYLELVRNPKHGYGSGMNPCLDCQIYMFRQAWEFGRKFEAGFLVTGDILGQRPMSQRLDAIRVIDREAGLTGKVLRPLSAQHLPETEPELQGRVRREDLLAFRGRTRRPQLELARRVGLDAFSCPAGGCLLTDRQFAGRLRDLLDHHQKLAWADVRLLTVGRHFRLDQNKFVVGRDEIENRILDAAAGPENCILTVTAPDCGSPTTLLQGPRTRPAIATAAALTARYADCAGPATVSVRTGARLRPRRCTCTTEQVTVEPLQPAEVERLRLPEFVKHKPRRENP